MTVSPVPTINDPSDTLVNLINSVQKEKAPNATPAPTAGGSDRTSPVYDAASSPWSNGWKSGPETPLSTNSKVPPIVSPLGLTELLTFELTQPSGTTRRMSLSVGIDSSSSPGLSFFLDGSRAGKRASLAALQSALQDFKDPTGTMPLTPSVDIDAPLNAVEAATSQSNVATPTISETPEDALNESNDTNQLQCKPETTQKRRLAKIPTSGGELEEASSSNTPFTPRTMSILLNESEIAGSEGSAFTDSRPSRISMPRLSIPYDQANLFLEGMMQFELVQNQNENLKKKQQQPSYTYTQTDDMYGNTAEANVPFQSSQPIQSHTPPQKMIRYPLHSEAMQVMQDRTRHNQLPQVVTPHQTQYIDINNKLNTVYTAGLHMVANYAGKCQQNLRGSRTHVCLICHKNFLCASKLRRHMLTHTGEKPYECSCSQGFTQKSSLKTHLKRHDKAGNGADHQPKADYGLTPF